MKKLLVVYALLIIAFLLYLKDFQSHEATTNLNETKGLQGQVDEKYVMVTFQAGTDYWKKILKGFEDAGQALNVSVEYHGASQYDVKEQITVLEQVIARKPSGIALSAIHPDALDVTIFKAIDAGIPIVLFDSDAPKSNAYTFIGTNNVNAGGTAAHELAHFINRNGKVAVVTIPNQQNQISRLKGFQETIENQYPDIEIVGVKDGKGDQLVSEQVVIDLLTEHPDLKGIFLTEANGGVGAGRAVIKLKKDKDVKIVSFDTDKQTLDMVKAGTIEATLAQGTWSMGYWSLNYLFYLNHGLIKLPSDPYAQNKLPKMDTGITVVTKKNVDSYYAE
ncbi:substrate-binding domain-containing protein [Fredinandcohnia sp. QZ13]|uniref:substrate-binding domain-containing protein n=1 Tax=Fredinandcohnia sp. QZ13 TaxID=3073144 RepID=UPI0028537465|nr:substrate-binding domain-containing protein [Fredinandcohnia sp. QZ13]MDR4890074.1 substrate-binding domain-containing protein [Fredinandcohnia sp. QZ13]